MSMATSVGVRLVQASRHPHKCIEKRSPIGEATRTVTAARHYQRQSQIYNGPPSRMLDARSDFITPGPNKESTLYLSDAYHFCNPKSVPLHIRHADKKQTLHLLASCSSNFLAGEGLNSVARKGCAQAGRARRGAYAQVSSTSQTSSDNRPEEQQQPGLLKQVQISLAEVKPTPAQATRARESSFQSVWDLSRGTFHLPIRF